MKNRIKVVFDANPLAVPNKTGVGMYTNGLITNLGKYHPDDLQLVGYYYDFLGRKHPVLPKAPNITYKPIHLYPGKFVNLLRRFGIEIPVEFLAKTRADICLFPNFLSQPSIFKTPLIPVVHDLSFIDLPKYSSDRNRKDLIKHLPKTLGRSARVITVSDVSKNIIAKKLKFANEKILVTHIPPGPKEKISANELSRVKNKFKINKPYLLFVGTLEPRKNLINLLKAYETSKTLNSEYALVIAGGIDWKFDEILNKIEGLKRNGLVIIHTGYLKTKERNALYTGASVFVLPSHYEGFGMPILEAMSYSIPACISDIPVFHEVAGNAAVYFNKDDPEDIALKITNCLYEPARNKLIAREHQQLKKYSWEKVVNKVFEAFNELG